MQKQEEEMKQLERVKEGLLLDKDILNQLKVIAKLSISSVLVGVDGVTSYGTT